MTTETRPHDLREIWQTQATEASRPSCGELRARVERLRRKTRRRNVGALAACGIVFVGCIWWLVALPDPLARIGTLLTALGIATIVFQVRANQGSEQAAVRRAALMGGTASVAFHREELARQRDFHRGRHLWIRLLLFAPGPLVFFVGFSRAHPEVVGTIRFVTLAFVLLIVAAVPVNLWLARGYQRQLDELEALL